MIKGINYYILILSVLLGACQLNKNGLDEDLDKNINLNLQIKSYTKIMNAPTPDAGSASEQQIDNIYLFLFPTNISQSLIKYYIPTNSFAGGTWEKSNEKINLDLTQAEAGQREVYIVANCSSLKTTLDAITSLNDLKAVFNNNAQAWLANISAPLLMVGSQNHNFLSNKTLSGIALDRIYAKVQLNIRLGAKFQATPTINTNEVEEYQFRLNQFDTRTYLIKPVTKPNNLTSSAWTKWKSDDIGLTDEKVSQLTLTTYLNERDNAGSYIELQIPYTHEGQFPPPEFGDDNYKLMLPTEIKRNYWYVYDIDI